MRIEPSTPVVAVRPADAAEAASAKPGAPSPRLLNPAPVLDPALGIVVTEFFNRAGDLTDQYPTRRMLEGYRIHDLPEDGAPPSGSSA